MCGIFGYVSQRDQGDLLERMGRVIAHRGPDGHGDFHHGSFHMGMNRLAIIDMETGQQPIANETESLWITFNGEIYNYRELRTELQARGHVFRTQSDTETIVHGHEEYGDGVLHHLNGMFAIALYDKARERLLLARDRFGEKPLYYYKDDEIFMFASEIKSLMQYRGLPRELNGEALEHYLTLRYVPGPVTLMKNIMKLGAGQMMELVGGQCMISTYYRVPDAPLAPASEGEYHEKFRELFESAVNLRMRSDVPLGAYLSSGVDSTAIVSAMSRRAGKGLHTYTIGCGSAQDETRDAAHSAQILGCTHHETLYDETSLDLLEKIIWHLDEPIGDAHIIPTYLLAQSAAKSLKVVLLGEGSDESLFGYPFHRLRHMQENWSKRLPSWVLNGLAPLALKAFPLGLLDQFFPLPTSIGREGRDKLASYLRESHGLSETGRFVQLTSLFSPEEIRRMTGRTSAASKNPFALSGQAQDPMRAFFDVQMQGWLQDNILLRHDKMSMAHSIETRAPFLDHRLVEFLINLPLHMKFRDGKNKYILRHYLGQTMPPATAQRKKIPFFSPIERFSTTKVFHELVQRHLFDSDLGQLLDLSHIHNQARRDNQHDFLVVKKIMALVIFEIWRKNVLRHNV